MSDNWWESDPVVSSPTADAWWANDPIAEQKKEEEKKQTLISMLPRWIGAPLDTAATLASGAVAPIAAGWAGIAGATLPGPEGQGAQWTKAVQDALTHHPETGLARGVETAVAAPIEYGFMRPGKRAGEIAEALGAPPLVSTGIQTVIQGAPAMLPYAAKKIGYESPYSVEGSEPVRTAERMAAANDDAAAVAAKKAGFALPPNEVNQTALSQALTWISGDKNLQRALATKNQPKEQAIVREQLGMPEGELLSRDAYDAVRKDVGQAYDAVRNTGDSKVSPDYFRDLYAIQKEVQKTPNAYPNLPRKPILDTINALKEKNFNADAAVEMISELRADASASYASPTVGAANMGKQYKALANALEDELARHLQRSGFPELLADFQDARKTIAQTYTAQKYTAPSGEIRASALANELIKKGGAPLEGGMADVANLGANFPNAAKLPSHIGEVSPTMMDSAAGYIGRLGTHGLWSILGSTIGRPAAAKFTAGPYQRFVNPPDYGPSMANRAMSMVEEPTTGLGMSALGLESEDEKRRKMLAQILGGY